MNTLINRIAWVLWGIPLATLVMLIIRTASPPQFLPAIDYAMKVWVFCGIIMALVCANRKMRNIDRLGVGFLSPLYLLIWGVPIIFRVIWKILLPTIYGAIWLGRYVNTLLKEET